MRQVNEDELVHLIESGLRNLGLGIRKQLNDPRSEQRRAAQLAAARQMAGKFSRLEILSSAPPPPPFRWADFDGGSGVPPIDPD